MHRRANGLLDPDRRDLAGSICCSVTSVVGLRSRLLCFALLARGFRFKCLVARPSLAYLCTRCLLRRIWPVPAIPLNGDDQALGVGNIYPVWVLGEIASWAALRPQTNEKRPLTLEDTERRFRR